MKYTILPQETLQKAVYALEKLPFLEVNGLLQEILTNARDVDVKEEATVETPPSANNSSAPTSGPEFDNNQE